MQFLYFVENDFPRTHCIMSSLLITAIQQCTERTQVLCQRNPALVKMKRKSQCFSDRLINLAAFDLAAQSGSRLRKMSWFLQRAKVVPACITQLFPLCLLQQHLFCARPTLCFCSKAQQHSQHGGKLLMYLVLIFLFYLI